MIHNDPEKPQHEADVSDDDGEGDACDIDFTTGEQTGDEDLPVTFGG